MAHNYSRDWLKGVEMGVITGIKSTSNSPGQPFPPPEDTLSAALSARRWAHFYDRIL